MYLTPRLRAIYGKVAQNSFPVDVGTDHCYIPIQLYKSRKCTKIIATEISVNGFNRAKKMLEKEDLLDVIDIRLGDGLKPIKPGEIDTVIIAGMGGLTIVDILRSSPEVLQYVNTLILQPMTDQTKLRYYLLSSGFEIVDEDLAKERNKIYEIIVTNIRKNLNKPMVKDELYYEIGYNLIKKGHPLLPEYLDHKIKTTKSIIRDLKNSTSSKSKYKLDSLYIRLSKLKGVKKNVCPSSNNSTNN